MILDFGKLKELREDSGHTQESFAAAVGISSGTYRDMEQGKTGLPTADKLLRIATKLGVSIDEFTVKKAAKAKKKVKGERGRPKSPPSRFRLRGTIFADGSPDTCDPTADATGTITTTEIFGDAAKVFFCRVSGDSMTGYGIADGSLAAFHDHDDPHSLPSGSLVAVAISGVMVLKELGRSESGQLFLRSRSLDRRHRDIPLTDDDPGRLAGVFAGIVRPPGQPKSRRR